MTQDQHQAVRRERTITTIATFVTLMHASERGERTTAADALDELAKLGVTVKISDPPIETDASRIGVT